MISVLEKTNVEVGYVYCGFEYKGYRNIQFPVRDFDPNLILYRNYISTMSIHKIGHWKKYGRFDLNLFRYQDWDIYLNYLLVHHIRGIPCTNAYFYALSDDKDISMKKDKNYKHLIKIIKKYNLPIKIEVSKDANL